MREIKKLKSILASYKKELIILTFTAICVCSVSFVTPLISQLMFDQGVLEKDIGVLIAAAIVLLIINVVNSCLEIYQFYIELKMKNEIEKELKIKILERSFRLKMKYYNNLGYYKVISDALYSVDNVIEIFSDNFLTVFAILFKTVGACCGLFFLSWQLALIVLLFIPLKYIVNFIFGKKIKNCMQLQLKTYQKFNSWIDEIIDGIKDVKLWGLQKAKIYEVNHIFQDMKEVNIKRGVLDEINNQITNNMDFSISYLVYLLGIGYLTNLNLTVGTVLAFVSYSGYLQNPLNVLLDLKVSIEKLKPAFEELENFFELETEEDVFLQKRKIPKEITTIKFENVGVSIDGKDILKNANFCIHKKEKVALVGENGSGKTTLINLLLRLVEPTTGKILIDGVDIKLYDINEYRRLISTVMQSVHLFSGTIEKNIFISGNSMVENINNNFAMNFIQDFPEGLKTNVGVTGKKLSGGERQKIGFLRAINRKAKILVLDEATSNYDYQSEQEFNYFVKEDSSFDFYFIVTHRKDILTMVDKIIYIKDGIARMEEQ